MVIISASHTPPDCKFYLSCISSNRSESYYEPGRFSLTIAKVSTATGGSKKTFDSLPPGVARRLEWGFGRLLGILLGTQKRWVRPIYLTT